MMRVVVSALLATPFMTAAGQAGGRQTLPVSPADSGVRTTASVPGGFAARRAKGIGVFFTPEQVAHSHASAPSELLQTLSFVSLVAVPSGHGVRFANSVRGSATLAGVKFGRPTEPCTPFVFIDGEKAPNVEIDDLYMKEILAIEVYQSPAMVPPQFVSGGAMGCGTIVVWTPQAK